MHRLYHNTATNVLWYASMHTKRTPLENSKVTAKVEHIGTQVESFLLSLPADHQITRDLLPVATQKGLHDTLQLSQDTRIFCLR